MTITPTASEPYRKLSELVQTFAPEDLLLILDDFEEGLATTLQALPLAEKFEAKVLERDGRLRKRQLVDELLLFTPDAEQWFSHKAHGTRQLHLEQRGNVPVNLDRILAGQDNFAALFEARRKFFIRKLEEKAQALTPPTPSTRKGSGKKPDKRGDESANEGGRKRGRKPTATVDQPQDDGKGNLNPVVSDA